MLRLREKHHAEHRQSREGRGPLPEWLREWFADKGVHSDSGYIDVSVDSQCATALQRAAGGFSNTYGIIPDVGLQDMHLHGESSDFRSVRIRPRSGLSLQFTTVDHRVDGSGASCRHAEEACARYGGSLSGASDSRTSVP